MTRDVAAWMGSDKAKYLLIFTIVKKEMLRASALGVYFFEVCFCHWVYREKKFPLPSDKEKKAVWSRKSKEPVLLRCAISVLVLLFMTCILRFRKKFSSQITSAVTILHLAKETENTTGIVLVIQRCRL